MDGGKLKTRSRKEDHDTNTGQNQDMPSQLRYYILGSEKINQTDHAPLVG